MRDLTSEKPPAEDAMRSYEYLLYVSGPRKTSLLLVEEIEFYFTNREINHISLAIFESDTVTLTF